MSYRSIITYVDGDADSAMRLAAAIDVARQFDAHLSVLGIGYEPYVPFDGYGAPSAMVVADLLAQAQTHAADQQSLATDAIAQAGILGDASQITCQYGGIGRRLADHAQFADLVVLSRPLGDNVPATTGDAFNGALFDSDRPVMVCPEHQGGDAPETVMIAWSDTREALRATRRSLPFLKRADRVEIVVVGSATHESDTGERLALMLARHGVTAEVMVVPTESEPVSKVLMRRAVELGAGLIVMGGFGHSRFREYVIGGVTREILLGSNIPLVMAH